MYLADEAKIIDRLRAKLAANVHVESLDELARVPEKRRKAPAVFVVHEGYQLGDSSGPRVQQIVNQWSVVVACKTAVGGGDTAQARADVDALVRGVIGALLGYQLRPGAYLRLAPAAGPQYEGGFAYLPLSFTAPATFMGDPD